MPPPAAFATLATVATLTAALAVAPWGAGAEAQISFDPQVTYSAIAKPDGVAFGDFGGDGRPELAATMGGPDRVEIRTSLTADDGTVVFSSTDERRTEELKGVNGTYGHVATIPLKGVAPGRYVLRVDARSTASNGGAAAREIELRVR